MDGFSAPLWIRSVRRRPATAGALVIVAGLTMATAVSGPILLRSVAEAGLRDSVAAAGHDTDILVSARSDRAADRSRLAATLTGIAAAARPPFGPGRVTLLTSDAVRWQSGSAVLAAPDCAAVVLTAGRCPAGPREVVLPGGRPGDRVTVRGSFTVVGGYDPARSGALLHDLTADAGVPLAGSGPPLLVSAQTVTDLPLPVTVAVRSSPGTFGLDDVPAAQDSVRLVQEQVIAAQTGSVAFTAGLPDVLARADADRQAAATLVFVIAAQALALALAGAAGVMAAIARARTPEWALGRLRGRRLLAVVGIEPVVLTLSGALAGAAAGWAACRAVIPVIVPGGAPVDLWRAPVLAAGLVTVGALVAAALIAGLRSARAPVATLLREAADPPRTGRFALVAEATVVALALAAGAQLLLQPRLDGTAGRLALVAPGLIAAALVLIAIRIATALVRRPGHASVAGLLVGRSLARSPAQLLRQVPVAVGAALLVFATQLALLSSRNQGLHADAAVGAATVLTVAVPPGADLRALVQAADPSGTSAMAVEERAGSTDTGTSRVIAVDSSRLAAVSAWRPGPGIPLLTPALPAPVVLRGSRVTVTVPAASVTPEPSTAAPTDPAPTADLVLVVAAPGGWQRIVLGPLDFSHRTLQAALPCAAGCRVVRFELRKSAPTPFDADVTISTVSTDRQTSAELAGGLAGPWRPVLGVPGPGQPPQATASGSAAGLRIRAVSYPGDLGAPAVAPADTPDPLPAVLSRGTQAASVAGHPGTVGGTGLDGEPQLLQVVGIADVLPRSLDDGVLVDLGTAAGLADPALTRTTLQVWLAADADPRVTGRLTAAGVRVLGTERQSDAARALGRSTPARAVVADLAVAVAALALVLVLLVAGRVIDTDRRHTLWTVGRLSGLSRGRLMRIAAAEIAAPAGVAVLIGAAAGVLSLTLAGNRLPLFAVGTPGPPLDVRPGPAALAAVVAAVLLLVAGTAVATARTERRSS